MHPFSMCVLLMVSFRLTYLFVCLFIKYERLQLCTHIYSYAHIFTCINAIDIDVVADGLVKCAMKYAKEHEIFLAFYYCCCSIEILINDD